MTRSLSALVVFGVIGVMGVGEATSRVCYLDPGAAVGWQVADRAAAERQVRDAVKRYDVATRAMDAERIAAFYLPDGELWTNVTLTQKGQKVAHVIATDAGIDARGHVTFEWVRDAGGVWRIAKAETTPLKAGGLEAHR
jgi:hypothetical protein